MPSHREAFGILVLEAGLPVYCAGVPAAQELGGAHVTVFAANVTPRAVASRLAARARRSPVAPDRGGVTVWAGGRSGSPRPAGADDMLESPAAAYGWLETLL
jgi:hypothetical protein